MAADLTSLTRRDHIGRVGNGPGSVKSFWGYVTSDGLATVKLVGYFNSPSTGLVAGDVIDCISSAGATPVYTPLVVQTVTAAGIVAVA